MYINYKTLSIENKRWKGKLKKYLESSENARKMLNRGVSEISVIKFIHCGIPFSHLSHNFDLFMKI